MRTWVPLLLSGGLALVLAASCGEATCENGLCTCEAGANCDFECDAPPCHVDCGEGSDCSGACANGTCECAPEATCDFACDAPPCHVTCAGDNPSCSGTCANGTCACGSNSSCAFTCSAGPCHVTCDGTCVVDCPPDTAGTQNCDITSCAAGEIVVCPGGAATTCGAPCP
ncbi:MAG: hypothetical protein JNL21_26560 [Myxococcales bacterium]|nr:hypothetical protein [Myxococcales bacterium]